MGCDELANPLEGNVAGGSTSGCVLSGGATGVRSKGVLVGAGAVQGGAQLFAGIAGIEQPKVVALWSRARAGATRG